MKNVSFTSKVKKNAWVFRLNQRTAFGAGRLMQFFQQSWKALKRGGAGQHAHVHGGYVPTKKPQQFAGYAGKLCRIRGNKRNAIETHPHLGIADRQRLAVWRRVKYCS